MRNAQFLSRSGIRRFRSTSLVLTVAVSLLTLLQHPGPRFSSASTTNLTGNWAVKTPRNDGTFAKAYFNLRHEGSNITGTIRATQFYYTITESTGGPEGFTVVAKMKDGPGERTVRYEGKIVGDELHLSTRRRPEDKPTESVARRVPDGEGAMPARLPLPPLKKVPYNGLAKTPPMGWNSWNLFRGRVSDEIVRGIADAMVSSGMRDAGYIYVNIDDTWEGESRDANGNITTNNKFPDMKALADYVHAKGLKLGIYSSPGPNTCAGYQGSYGHEEQDAKTFAAWGIDYIKYDWCGARTLYSDEEMQAVYQKMGEALLKTGRPIVYSLCQYGRNDVWKWGPEVGGNLWRTTGDISDNWNSMTRIGFSQNDLAPYAKPGHWNDPDMLEVGNGGMTNDEYKIHMSLWAILAAPLLAGNDIRNMTPETKAILLNREVIAVDQDKLGIQGKRMWQSGDIEIWVRELSGGARAVGVFNRGTVAKEVTVRWSEIGITNDPKQVRDLWEHKDIKTKGPEHTFSVPPHGVSFLRVVK
jgi:alpha-galactosidase